ncbi:probable 28S ribosomal protein S26, mitochondrial isoform X2 [Vespula pensylvanica]|uniref:probable 28S ribosomal protein S26, mitochondrial isoform X2 n=1 Tax=Vespula pensylvanica TaxID=30213 RepID=UPI001CBA5870|nr:probable 28S ribosomal protein S26, mitochondrial isoform X2 [Vespula pensylvanica]
MCISINYIFCIRWKRKPIWLPTAKSKVFRVPQRPKIPTEEYIELKRLNNNYRTAMKSLMQHFENEFKKSQVQFDEITINKIADEDFIQSNLINDEWNMQIAKIREVRLAKEKEERKETILKKLLKKEERDKQREQKIEEHVKKLKEEVPTFITAANIDKAIEEALINIVNHEYAIDLKGNIYTDSKETSVNSNNIVSP